MIDPLFLITFLIIVAIIVIGGLWLTRKKRSLKKIRKEWETKQFIYINEDVDSISTYWNNKKDGTSYYGVDEVTWNDLAMDEIFKEINYTKTSVGTEYLFNQLRDIDLARDLQKDEEFYQLLETDDQLRENLLVLLTGLGKLNYLNTSSFFYNHRSNQLKYSVIYSILVVMPIASVGIVFIKPVIGLLMILASFAVNVLLYYLGKSKLEDEIFATAYLASLVDAGKKIAEIKNPQFQEHVSHLAAHLQPLKKTNEI